MRFCHFTQVSLPSLVFCALPPQKNFNTDSWYLVRSRKKASALKLRNYLSCQYLNLAMSIKSSLPVAHVPFKVIRQPHVCIETTLADDRKSESSKILVLKKMQLCVAFFSFSFCLLTNQGLINHQQWHSPVWLFRRLETVTFGLIHKVWLDSLRASVDTCLTIVSVLLPAELLHALKAHSSSRALSQSLERLSQAWLGGRKKVTCLD